MAYDQLNGTWGPLLWSAEDDWRPELPKKQDVTIEGIFLSQELSTVSQYGREKQFRTEAFELLQALKS